MYDFDDDIQANEFAEIFARIYVILSILSSRDYVLLELFRPYVHETHIRLNKLAPWMKVELLNCGVFRTFFNRYLIHCVAYLFAVWPVYTIKCLCSRGWE